MTSTTGHVVSVDPVTDKWDETAWQVVTDYAEKDADGLTRCAIWLPRPGPVPPIGAEIGWGHSLMRGAWASWGGERYKRIGYDFDPGDPRIYTG